MSDRRKSRRMGSSRKGLRNLTGKERPEEGLEILGEEERGESKETGPVGREKSSTPTSMPGQSERLTASTEPKHSQSSEPKKLASAGWLHQSESSVPSAISVDTGPLTQVQQSEPPLQQQEAEHEVSSLSERKRKLGSTRRGLRGRQRGRMGDESPDELGEESEERSEGGAEHTGRETTASVVVLHQSERSLPSEDTQSIVLSLQLHQPQTSMLNEEPEKPPKSPKLSQSVYPVPTEKTILTGKHHQLLGSESGNTATTHHADQSENSVHSDREHPSSQALELHPDQLTVSELEDMVSTPQHQSPENPPDSTALITGPPPQAQDSDATLDKEHHPAQDYSSHILESEIMMDIDKPEDTFPVDQPGSSENKISDDNFTSALENSQLQTSRLLVEENELPVTSFPADPQGPGHTQEATESDVYDLKGPWMNQPSLSPASQEEPGVTSLTLELLCSDSSANADKVEGALHCEEVEGATDMLQLHQSLDSTSADQTKQSESSNSIENEKDTTPDLLHHQSKHSVQQGAEEQEQGAPYLGKKKKMGSTRKVRRGQQTGHEREGSPERLREETGEGAEEVLGGMAEGEEGLKLERDGAELGDVVRERETCEQLGNAEVELEEREEIRAEGVLGKEPHEKTTGRRAESGYREGEGQTPHDSQGNSTSEQEDRQSQTSGLLLEENELSVTSLPGDPQSPDHTPEAILSDICDQKVDSGNLSSDDKPQQSQSLAPSEKTEDTSHTHSPPPSQASEIPEEDSHKAPSLEERKRKLGSTRKGRTTGKGLGGVSDVGEEREMWQEKEGERGRGAEESRNEVIERSQQDKGQEEGEAAGEREMSTAEHLEMTGRQEAQDSTPMIDSQPSLNPELSRKAEDSAPSKEPHAAELSKPLKAEKEGSREHAAPAERRKKMGSSRRGFRTQPGLHGNSEGGKRERGLGQIMEKSGEEDAEIMDILQKIQEIFHSWDREEKGFITREDMQELGGELGLSARELQQVFDGLDRDGDGLVTHQDFSTGIREFLESQKNPKSTPVALVYKSQSSVPPEDVDDEERQHFLSMMDNLGAHNLLQDQLEIWKLWEELRHNEPHLLSNLEEFVAKVTAQIRAAQQEKETLELTLKKRILEHNQGVQQLYEEMEHQISQEKERVRSESFKKSRTQRTELQRELEKKTSEMQSLIEVQNELEDSLHQLRSQQRQTSSENKELRRTNRELEGQLERIRAQLQEAQSRVRDMRSSVAQHQPRFPAAVEARDAEQSFRELETASRPEMADSKCTVWDEKESSCRKPAELLRAGSELGKYLAQEPPAGRPPEVKVPTDWTSGHRTRVISIEEDPLPDLIVQSQTGRLLEGEVLWEEEEKKAREEERGAQSKEEESGRRETEEKNPETVGENREREKGESRDTEECLHSMTEDERGQRKEDERRGEEREAEEKGERDRESVEGESREMKDGQIMKRGEEPREREECRLQPETEEVEAEGDRQEEQTSRLMREIRDEEGLWREPREAGFTQNETQSGEAKEGNTDKTRIREGEADGPGVKDRETDKMEIKESETERSEDQEQETERSEGMEWEIDSPEAEGVVQERSKDKETEIKQSKVKDVQGEGSVVKVELEREEAEENEIQQTKESKTVILKEPLRHADRQDTLGERLGRQGFLEQQETETQPEEGEKETQAQGEELHREAVLEGEILGGDRDIGREMELNEERETAESVSQKDKQVEEHEEEEEEIRSEQVGAKDEDEILEEDGLDRDGGIEEDETFCTERGTEEKWDEKQEFTEDEDWTEDEGLFEKEQIPDEEDIFWHIGGRMLGPEKEIIEILGEDLYPILEEDENEEDYIGEGEVAGQLSDTEQEKERVKEKQQEQIEETEADTGEEQERESSDNGKEPKLGETEVTLEEAQPEERGSTAAEGNSDTAQEEEDRLDNQKTRLEEEELKGGTVRRREARESENEEGVEKTKNQELRGHDEKAAILGDVQGEEYNTDFKDEDLHNEALHDQEGEMVSETSKEEQMEASSLSAQILGTVVDISTWKPEAQKEVEEPLETQDKEETPTEQGVEDFNQGDEITTLEVEEEETYYGIRRVETRVLFLGTKGEVGETEDKQDENTNKGTEEQVQAEEIEDVRSQEDGPGIAEGESKENNQLENEDHGEMEIDMEISRTDLPQQVDRGRTEDKDIEGTTLEKTVTKEKVEEKVQDQKGSEEADEVYEQKEEEGIKNEIPPLVKNKEDHAKLLVEMKEEEHRSVFQEKEETYQDEVKAARAMEDLRDEQEALGVQAGDILQEKYLTEEDEEDKGEKREGLMEQETEQDRGVVHQREVEDVLKGEACELDYGEDQNMELLQGRDRTAAEGSCDTAEEEEDRLVNQKTRLKEEELKGGTVRRREERESENEEREEKIKNEELRGHEERAAILRDVQGEEYNTDFKEEDLHNKDFHAEEGERVSESSKEEQMEESILSAQILGTVVDISMWKPEAQKEVEEPLETQDKEETPTEQGVEDFNQECEIPSLELKEVETLFGTRRTETRVSVFGTEGKVRETEEKEDENTNKGAEEQGQAEIEDVRSQKDGCGIAEGESQENNQLENEDHGEMEIDMEISRTDLPQQVDRGRTEDKDIEGTTLEKTVTKEKVEEKVQDQKCSAEAVDLHWQNEEEGIKHERPPLVKNEEDHAELLVEKKEEEHRSVLQEKEETYQDEVKTPCAKEDLRDDQEAMGGQAGDILQEKHLTEEEEEGEGGRREGLMDQETEQDRGVVHQREVEDVLKGEACELDYGEDQNMELLQGRDSTAPEGSCDTAEEEEDRLDNQKTRLKEEELKGGTVRRREERESENEEREEKIKNEELRGHEERAAILRDVQGEEYNTDFNQQDLHSEDFHAEEGERVSETSKEEQMEASILSAQILGTVVDISMWKPEAQKEVEEPLETQDKEETPTEQGVEDFNQECEIPSLELKEVETLFGTRRTETRVSVFGTEGKVGETEEKEDENTNKGDEEQGQAEIEDVRSQKDGCGIAEGESQENNQLENEDLGEMQIEMEISRTDLPQQEDRGKTEDKDMRELTQEGMVTNKETDEKFQDQNGSEGGDEVHWRKEEEEIKHERPPLVKNEEYHAELLVEKKEQEHRSVLQEKEETYQDEVKTPCAKEDLRDDQEAMGGQAGDILQEKHLTEEEEEGEGGRREGLMDQETEQDRGVVHQREVEDVLKGEACELDYGEDQNMELLQGRDSTAPEGSCDTAEEEEDRLDNQKTRLKEEELKGGTVRRREERESENEEREEKIKNEELRGHEERAAILRDVQGEEYNTDFNQQDLHSEDFHAEEGERVSETSKEEQMEASILSAQILGTVVDISMWKPEAQKEVEEPLETQDKEETPTEQGVEDFNQECEIPSLELKEVETLFGTRRTETRVSVFGTEGKVGETEEKEDENTNKGDEEQGQAEIEDVRSQKDGCGIAEGESQENNQLENEDLGEMQIEMEISRTDLPQQEDRGKTEDKDMGELTQEGMVTNKETDEKFQDQNGSEGGDEVHWRKEEEEIKHERPPLVKNEEYHAELLVEMKEEEHRSVFQEKKETYQDEVKAARAMEDLRDDQEATGGLAGDILQEKYLTEEDEEGEGEKREGLMEQETEQDIGVVHQREVEAALKGEACKLDYCEDQNMELLQGRDRTAAEGSCDTAEEEEDRLDNQKIRLEEEELKGVTARRREEIESENEEREEKIKNEELRGHEERAAILRDVQGEEYNTDFKEEDLHNEDFHAEEGERVSESSKEEQMEESSLSAQILGTVVDISMWKPEAQNEGQEPLETQDKEGTPTEQGVEDFNQECEIPSLELKEVETLFGTRRTETRVSVFGTEGKVREAEEKEDENTNQGTEEQGQAEEIKDVRSQKDGPGIAEGKSQENNQLENEDLGEMQIEMDISWTDRPQQENRGRTEDKDIEGTTLQRTVTKEEVEEKVQDQKVSGEADEVNEQKEDEGFKNERPPLVKNEEDHPDLLVEMKEEEHRSVFQEKEETHLDEVKAARAMEDLRDDQEALGGLAGDILQEKYLTEEEEEGEGGRREGLMEQETEQDGGVVHQREVEAVLKGEGKEQRNHGDDTEHDETPEHMAEEKSVEVMNSQDEDKILIESEIVSENQTNPGASGEEGKGEIKKDGENGGKGETTERRDRNTVLEVEGDIQVKDEMVSGEAEEKRVEQVDFVGEDGVTTKKQAEEGRDEAKVTEVKQELRSTEEGKDGGSGKMRQVGEIKEALGPKAQVQGEEKQLAGAEESIGEEKMDKKRQEEDVKESIVITEEEEGASKCEDVIELFAEVDIFQANASLLEEEKKLREEVTQSKEQVVTGYHKVTGWMEMNQEGNIELEETEKEIKREQKKGKDSEAAVQEQMREEEKPKTAGGEGGDKEIAEIEMKEVEGREIEAQENRGRELAEKAGEECHKREEETVVEEDRGMDLGVGCVREKGEPFVLREEGLGEGVQEITQATVGSSDDWVGKAGEEQTQELEIRKENDEFQDPSLEPVIKQEAMKVRAELLGTAQGIGQHAAGASVIGQNKGAISHMEQEMQQGEEEKQWEGTMEKLLDQNSLRTNVRTLQREEEMLREGVSPIDSMEDTEQEKRNAKDRYEEEEDDMLNEYKDEEQQQNGNQKEKQMKRQEKLDLTVKSETDKARLEDQHVVFLAQIKEAGSSEQYLQEDDYSRDEEIKGGLLKEEGLSDPDERKLDDTAKETGCEEIAMENNPTQQVKHPDVEEDILKEDETERERTREEEREKNEKSKQKITRTQEQEKEQTEKDAGEETTVREEKWMPVREAGTEEDSEYKREEGLKVKVTSQEKEEGRDLEKGQEGEEMGATTGETAWVEQESQKKEPISGDECQRGEEEEGLSQNTLPEELKLKDRVQEQEEEIMKTFVDKQDKVMGLLGDMHEYEQVTEGHEDDIKKEFEEIAEVMKGTNEVQTVKEQIIAEGETTSEKEEKIRDENQEEKAGRTAVTVRLLQEEILRENGIEQKVVEQEFLDEASIRYSKEETENKVERETDWTEEQGKKVTQQKEQELGEEVSQEGKVRRDEWRESGLEKDKKSLAEKGREISAETGTALELHWEKVKDGQEKKGGLEEREESEHEEVKEKQELRGEVLTVGGTETGQEGEGQTVGVIETGQEVEFLTVSMTETGQEGEVHTVGVIETGQEGEVHTVGVIETGQEREILTVVTTQTGQEGVVHTVGGTETGQGLDVIQEKDHKLSKEVKSAREDFIPTGLEEGEGRGGRKEVEIMNVPVQGQEPWGQVKGGGVEDRRGRVGQLDTKGQGGAEGFGRRLLIPASDEPRGLACLPPGEWTPPLLGPERLYNVVMVGDSSVGKTCFLKRFQSGVFSADHCATIGMDSCIQKLTLDGRRIDLQLWDTAGQERYHSITKQFLRKASALVIMYDIGSARSFAAVRYWITCIQEGAADNVVILLLGNKSDSFTTREVPPQEGERLAREYGIQFLECSAASGYNVTSSMETLARMLSDREEQGQDDMVTLKEPPKKKSGCC